MKNSSNKTNKIYPTTYPKSTIYQTDNILVKCQLVK